MQFTLYFILASACLLHVVDNLLQQQEGGFRALTTAGFFAGSVGYFGLAVDHAHAEWKLDYARLLGELLQHLP